MAGKTIKIAPGTCDQPPITVDHPIVLLKNNHTLKFKNDLVAAVEGDDAPTAVITFYDIYGKGGAAYDDFCDGYPGTTFSVPPGGGPLQCDPTTDGEFSYTVTATDYQDLDPVIIIEPRSRPGGSQSFMVTATNNQNLDSVIIIEPGSDAMMRVQSFEAPTLDLVTPGLALLIGLSMGYFFARK
jgi:hypothetical protein